MNLGSRCFFILFWWFHLV